MIMEQFFWILGVLFCVLCTVIGVAGNTLTIGVFVKFNHLRTHFGYFTLSLAVVDITTSLFVIPVNSFYFIHEGKWTMGRELCTANLFFSYGNVTTSGLMISLIAINRCVRICCSQGTYDRIYSTRSLLLSIAVAWLYAHLLVVLCLMGIGGELIFSESEGKCTLGIDTMWAVAAITYFVELITIVICYTKIYLTVKVSNAAMKRQSCRGRETNDNWRLFKTLLVTTTAYVICFLTPVLVWFVRLDPGLVSSAVESFFFLVPIFVSVAINPIIYGLMNNQYREGYRELLKSLKCSKSKTLTPCSAENTQTAETKSIQGGVVSCDGQDAKIQTLENS